MTQELIQFAKPEDINQIIAYNYSSYKENGLEEYGMPTSFDLIALTTTNCVLNDVTLVKRNEDNDDLIEGVIMCKTDGVWWSDRKALFTPLFFINPKYRSYKTAMSLLKAAQEYAIMMDMPLVIDLIGTKDVEKKKILFKRAGFSELGSLYVFKP